VAATHSQQDSQPLEVMTAHFTACLLVPGQPGMVTKVGRAKSEKRGYAIRVGYPYFADVLQTRPSDVQAGIPKNPIRNSGPVSRR